ncbi:MFS transporter [Roseobacter sinensis]|uniref:MFS transporter n=1 Tax=Roseobacter sinensis TaxID=2931391 RepID=A0ABT3BJ39_9RHOB|nr:MFS transporter [Roseobacter sp. WL0113]MCV3273596.1 MFS transporter [Roseobacter sp. WL0113]
MSLASQMTGVADAIADKPPEDRRAVITRSSMIALIAFLTLIDLFGSQALLPTLVETYGVSPATMGFAVNASTIGMAASSLIVAIFARHIDRRRGIWVCLALLSLPTMALAFTNDLTTFTLLRVAQGVFMAAAFTLTLTYLSEICSVTALGGAMAAYITGNVASNLLGRLMAAGLTDNLGLAESFLGFAVLNLLGAIAAYLYFGGRSEPITREDSNSVLAAWADHAKNLRLLAMIAIGFILLFVFVATFTYANFILASEVFALSQAAIGLTYFVFLPAIFTTPIAAKAIPSLGAARAFQLGILASLIGLGLLLTSWLPGFLLGLALVGAGLFFAQSVATASVARTVTHDHAAANGIYLSSYYVGGIVGAWLIGQVFEMSGWTSAIILLLTLTTVAGILSYASMKESVR